MNSLYRIIPFNVRHGNCGGSLVQFQQGDSEVNALPFEIGKVLVMSEFYWPQEFSRQGFQKL